MRDHRTIAILFAILFLASADNQMLIPLLPRMDLGVDVECLGWLISGYALGAFFFNLFLGPLTDRYGRVLFFRLGLLAFVATALGSYLAPTFGSLLSLRTLTGVTAGLLSTCTASYVGDRFPYEVRGRVMGIVLSSYFAALILGIPAGAAIAQAWGWRSVFLASACLSLLLAGAAFFMPSDRPTDRASRSASSWRTYAVLLRRADTLAAVWVSFGISGATLAFLTYISPFLNQRFELDPLRISLVFLIAGVAALLGSPTAGWLCDRFTKRSVFLISNTLLALPLLAIPTLGWGIWFFAALFLIGLCIAFRQTALQTVQASLTDKHQRGSYLALRNGFSQLGIAVSVFVAGRLYSWNGYQAVAWLAVALTLVSSALFFIAIREENLDRPDSGVSRGE
ncbi:MAG: MFS transporter [Acidobacteriota bacterium]